MKYIIGIYVKPGYLKVAMYDKRGHYLHFWEDNSHNTEPDYISEKISEGLSSLIVLRRASMEDVIGVGITLEGNIDSSSGVVKEARELNWHEVNFRETVQEQLGKPVFIDNLTDCQALAEMWQGAGWGKKNMMFVDCAGSLQGRVIRNKKIDGHLESLDTEMVFDGPKNIVKALMPIMSSVIRDIKPEIVILNGFGESEDSEFWRDLNEYWQRQAEQEVPELVSSELGVEGFTVGAAALVVFS